MMISRKQDDLNQINQLRINALEKILSEKSMVITQLQTKLEE